MKRPSFQFYPGDWAANPNLKRCNFAEKGIWLEVMCLMHDQAEYGVLRWPLKEIAEAVKCRAAELQAIVRKGVLKGNDAQLDEAFIYVPRSGRKDGAPVTLVPTQAGPVWYSSRMVKDEYVRSTAGAATRFGASADADKAPARAPGYGTERAKLRQRVFEKTDGQCYHCKTLLDGAWEIDHLMPRSKGGRHIFTNLVPSCVPCNQDKSDTLPDDWASPTNSPARRVGERQGEYQGDGSSSSSSSSSSPSGNTSEAKASGAVSAKPPRVTDPDEIIFGYGVPLLVSAGSEEKHARSFLGKLRKDHGDTRVVDALRDCVKAKPLQPLEWLAGALPPKGKSSMNRQEAIEADGKRVAAEWLAEQGGCA
jgi:hypothetical protein